MTDQIDLSRLLREAAPQHRAPQELRVWAEQQARAIADSPTDPSLPSTVPQRRATTHWLRRSVYAAGLIAAVAIGWAGRGSIVRSVSEREAKSLVADELIDAHVRSLMLDHLVDVRSSDRHTVKPWFAGKADIAPSVPELAPRGFPLLGGRLDYVDGHPSTTVVYGRRQHVISLFIWRAGGAGTDRLPATTGTSSRRGYHVLSWPSDDLMLSAVSDVDATELAQFREAYMAAK